MSASFEQVVRVRVLLRVPPYEAHTEGARLMVALLHARSRVGIRNVSTSSDALVGEVAAEAEVVGVTPEVAVVRLATAVRELTGYPVTGVRAGE